MYVQEGGALKGVMPYVTVSSQYSEPEICISFGYSGKIWKQGSDRFEFEQKTDSNRFVEEPRGNLFLADALWLCYVCRNTMPYDNTWQYMAIHGNTNTNLNMGVLSRRIIGGSSLPHPGTLRKITFFSSILLPPAALSSGYFVKKL
jgi:hypothetical protein